MQRLVLTAIAVVVMLTSMVESAMANNSKTNQIHNQDAFVRAAIRTYIDDPLMEKIAGCESTNNPDKIVHWEPDGVLLKNTAGSSARGALQILTKLHRSEIERLGLDMTKLSDYMEFAKYLRDTQGYGAWNPSKHCWGKYAKLGTR